MYQHFDWDLTHQVLFLYILPSHHMNLRDQPWKMLILWWRTDICSSTFSAKVSLMLNNPFLVPFLCKLNHISLCVIQSSTKSPAKLLSPFRESNVFWTVRDIYKLGNLTYFGEFAKLGENLSLNLENAS